MAIECCQYFADQRQSVVYLEEIHGYMIEKKIPVARKEYSEFFKMFVEHFRSCCVKFGISFVMEPKEELK
jgi:hypothetical protein